MSRACALRHDRHGAVRAAQRELLLGQDPVVAGIGIGGPLGETGLTCAAAADPAAGSCPVGGQALTAPIPSCSYILPAATTQTLAIGALKLTLKSRY
jgi:hypothetical protein